MINLTRGSLHRVPHSCLTLKHPQISNIMDTSRHAKKQRQSKRQKAPLPFFSSTNSARKGLFHLCSNCCCDNQRLPLASLRLQRNKQPNHDGVIQTRWLLLGLGYSCRRFLCLQKAATLRGFRHSTERKQRCVIGFCSSNPKISLFLLLYTWHNRKQTPFH